ncbi:hypothetical protein PMIN06_006631 [Paraphaeosphaeria minitans]
MRARCDVTFRTTTPSLAQKNQGEEGKAPVFASGIRVSADGSSQQCGMRVTAKGMGMGLELPARLHWV